MESDAMVSVSSGAMNSLLMKLETLTGERYAEITGTDDKWSILKDEIQAINALLKQLSNIADPNMKKCRNQMRALTYDIEDAIDNLMVTFVDKKSSVSPRKRVIRVMPHGFIDQIRELKAQVKEVDLQSTAPRDEMRNFGRSYMTREQWLSKVYDERNCLVGMDGPRKELVGRLIGGLEDELQGVCILGATGIGKTTLARQVYNEIKSQFDTYAFVSASKKVHSSDEDTIARICKSMLSQLRETIYISDTDMDSPINGVHRRLQYHRFLVVIHGVSAHISEDIAVVVPKNNRGSRIITTTHISDVAKSCAEHFSTSIYQMEPLSFKESLSLFRSVIFGSVTSCPVSLEKDREEVVKACGGIPLAIRVIAGALSSIPEEMEQRFTFREIPKQEEMGHAQWIREIFHIGYSYLSCGMKTCLLYLSTFPENHVMRKDRLIRRWVAEGFLTERRKESWWEIGERYFLELLARKLIEPVYDEEDALPAGCKVSGPIYDFITSLSSQENFIKSDVTHQTSDLHGVSQPLFVNLGSNNQKKQLALFQGALGSKVRSLTFERNLDPAVMPDLSAFKHLRVLDLEDTKGLRIEQPESIAHLSLLRYLRLSGTDVTKLPDETAALKQLTTLDLRRTGVKRLPELSTKLVSLLGDRLTIHSRMERMQNLEELSEVLLGPDGSSAQDVARLLDKLGRLRMLGVRFSHLCNQNGTDQQGVKHFLETVVGKSDLRSLLLDNYRHPLLDLLVDSWAYKQPSCLQKFELRISSCLPLVPQEIASLIALTHLHIHVEVVESQGVRVLGNLPSLVLLKLRSTSSQKLTVSSKDGFQCLKVFLYCCQCGDGMGMQFESGAMPQLQRLWLDLNLLETRPKNGCLDFGIQHLFGLVQVHATIEGKDTSTASEVESHIRDQVSKNPNRPVLELNRRGHGHLAPHQKGQFSTVKEAESVIEVHSLEEWSVQIEKANGAEPNKLVVIHFTASWCRPSRWMAPFFAELAKKHPNAIFLKVDVDELETIAQQFRVRAMPTFLFMKGGDGKDRRVVGTDKKGLAEMLERLSRPVMIH